MKSMQANFPFSAIVGQDDVKRAIMVAAIEPLLGGVLIFGDRGTGKSTAIRGLASLLPPMAVVAGCPFHCDPKAEAGRLCSDCAAKQKRKRTKGPLKSVSMAVPVIDVPLGVSEDRVLGALDLERALHHGEKAFEPGLLAAANRGFIYIDEVNLLEDHIVDLLLDVAASGENVVEREGLSVRHPARFVLVGSGNPEEGELRPQLLDRFGLAVDVSTPDQLDDRIAIIKRRDAFEQNPTAFLAEWEAEQASTREAIARAQEIKDQVQVSDELLAEASKLAIALGTDGLRGELTLVRAARALAALDGREAVELDDLKRMAPPAMRHRLRRDPLDEAGSQVRIERAMTEVWG